MDKRGQGLTLNTIIITILVILVLIVVVTFFFGGFKGLTDRIKGTFYSTSAGTDKVLAVQTCQQFCEQVKLLPTDTLKKNSAYCTTGFIIDGESKALDKGYNQLFSCSAKNTNIGKIKSNHNSLSATIIGLEIECPEVKCN